MTKLIGLALGFVIMGLIGLPAQEKAAPGKITFAAKNGAITFDHALHAQREKDNCAACHPAVFPQDAKAPLAYKPLHKRAEDKKTSCGFCHRAGGNAFESKANCTNGKCHVRAGAK